MKFTLVLTFLFLNACSVYRSQGRKQLESVEPSTIQSFTLEACQKQNSLKAWLQSEFPRRTYEIIFSDSDLEILKSTASDGSIEIRATQASEQGPSTCLYRFANDDAWKQHQSRFIQELENNMMISE